MKKTLDKPREKKGRANSGSSPASVHSLSKVVVVGDAGCGKSNIINRLTEKPFLEDNHPTVGVEFSRKHFVIDGEVHAAQVWDTAGQERFRGIPHLYYRGAAGIVVVFDLTERVSFRNVRTWVGTVRKNTQEDIPMVLLGNKTDLDTMRTTDASEARQLAKELKISGGYFETTAKHGTNIFLAFQHLLEAILVSRGGSSRCSVKFQKKLSKDAVSHPPSSFGVGMRNRSRSNPVWKEQGLGEAPSSKLSFSNIALAPSGAQPAVDADDADALAGHGASSSHTKGGKVIRLGVEEQEKKNSKWKKKCCK